MVTIIGGGIAGTLLAGALGRAAPVTVYESQPSIGAGHFLALDDRAHTALTRLGVGLDRLHGASHPLAARSAADPTGVVRSDSRTERRLYLRAELMRALTEFASATAAELHYDTPVTELNSTEGTLFSGGKPIPADEVIIAADGIDSLARRHLEPGRSAEYAGQIVVYGITTRPIRPHTDPSVLHFDRRFDAEGRPVTTFGHFWNDELSVWFTRLTREPMAVQDTGSQPLDGWAEPILAAAPTLDLVETMLAATETVHVSNARTVPLADALPPQAPVILCGDADHAITPAAGVGARDAIEDAAALAEALLSGGSPATAMAERRARILAERGAAAQMFRKTT
ncbi:2-polyprenyl-6-methoxyphenol hydroxylase-like FAD-dependent oxidoreductase [Nocardia tenerifensis]|uniref:2-polyprenyl-6-methoxyphenol hydroxylase-like FAD-dependent oxidoreductase n=1 Tax=Nocardia tenerifensis TaxID=228006 RepID=A0A318JWF6_9NOCA|nr:FAD-dependent monooxygenase [Nocardia tenerifensis]PXX60370.1 2-polyprenyl-6-methoxyphenol hydroxylase-like FAD-dependent oxidoreductase [Nocardia tenerifensis]